MTREFEGGSKFKILPTVEVKTIPRLYGIVGDGTIVKRQIKFNDKLEDIYHPKRLSNLELVELFNRLKKTEEIRDDPDFKEKFECERVISVGRYIEEGIRDYEVELRTGIYAKEAHGIFFPVIEQSLYKRLFEEVHEL